MILNNKNFYCISSRVEKSGQLYGCFKIGPFHGHQSLTFANLLRRTLLSDKSRCIFEAIQIYGVEHEFSSLVGIRESVIDIILNLEKIVFQMNKPITKPQVAIISFHGPGILRAQHIHLPTNIKCIIPSQYIATAEIDGQLQIKLFFTPNWYNFQQLLQKNIFKNEEKIFQKIRYPKFQYKKNTIQFKTKFSFLLNELKPITINLKYSTLLRYLPLLKNQFPIKLYKNNKINFNAITAIARFRQKPNSQYKKNPWIQNIKENFLFIQTSLSAIEKVHYTIQSNTKVIKETLTKLPHQYSPSQKNIKKIQNYKMQLKNQLSLNKTNKSFKKASNQSHIIEFNKPFLSTNNEEFILFELWTDGSIHPQKAIGKAINEILLELFPYSLYIHKNQKIHLLSIENNKSVKLFDQRYQIQNKSFNIQRKNITNSSKKQFFEKFLNLDISNFYLDLETYIYLKEKKIYRILDFLNFFKKININKKSQSMNFTAKQSDKFEKLSLLNITPKIQNTLLNFQKFITSFL